MFDHRSKLLLIVQKPFDRVAQNQIFMKNEDHGILRILIGIHSPSRMIFNHHPRIL